MEQKPQDTTQNNRHKNKLQILSAGSGRREVYNCLHPPLL